MEHAGLVEPEGTRPDHVATAVERGLGPHSDDHGGRGRGTGRSCGDLYLCVHAQDSYDTVTRRMPSALQVIRKVPSTDDSSTPKST